MAKIIKIKDNIAVIVGKEKYAENQRFKLSKEAIGIVLNAEKNKANLLVLGDTSEIQINSIVKKIEIEDYVKTYKHYFGKIISPFGNVVYPSDFKEPEKPILIGKSYLNNPSPSIMDRVKINKALNTGIMAVDSLIPIGKGQRELIIGDRSTGKTSLTLSTIVHQKDKNLKIVYVSIGQKKNTVIQKYNFLKLENAVDNLIYIYAHSDSATEQFYAPKIGMAMAESIAYNGEDVLIIIDDLTKHANIYREISLSMGINPGREAFPNDIFYQHSSLLERSGNFSSKYKNASITCIPIVETIQNDIASLIPSNIISITDGQIFTSVDMFNKSLFPSINISFSVSRTGSSVQSELMRKVSKGLKKKYSMLLEISKFANMSIEINENLEQKIKEWEGINNLFIQYGFAGLTEEMMAVMITLFNQGNLSNINKPSEFSILFRKFCHEDDLAKKVLSRINAENIDKPKIIQQINAIFVPFVEAASNKYGNLISSNEYNFWKGAK